MSQPSAVNGLAWGSMKDVAKCDKLCERQNFENQRNAERTLLSQATPGNAPISGRANTSGPQSPRRIAVRVVEHLWSLRCRCSVGNVSFFGRC